MQARIEGVELVTRSRFRSRIFDAWGHRCAYCDGVAQSLDHVIPKARGGATVPTNLVPACLPCNRRKGHREVILWWREQSFWTQAGQARLIDWMLAS
jgi:hypothetical protein